MCGILQFLTIPLDTAKVRLQLQTVGPDGVVKYRWECTAVVWSSPSRGSVIWDVGFESFVDQGC